MKKLTALTFVFAVLSLAFVAQPAKISAQDSNTKAETTANSEPTAAVVYAYTTQKDDSYTVLARKAIQTYGLENKVNLSGAQIVFAETNLTLEAGSPALSQGQKVEIKKDTVKSWVEKAQKLTDAQVKAWDYYVQFVDFDTRDNGEKR